MKKKIVKSYPYGNKPETCQMYSIATPLSDLSNQRTLWMSFGREKLAIYTIVDVIRNAILAHFLLSGRSKSHSRNGADYILLALLAFLMIVTLLDPTTCFILW